MAARVKEEGRKIDQAPLAEHYATQIEEQEGRQPLRVKAEGFPNCEGDDDDKELEEYGEYWDISFTHALIFRV